MPLSTHQAQVPALVHDYFGGSEHPVVEQVFDGAGWRSQRTFRKRVSVSWLRKLRAEGVTAVGLRSGARLADFTVEEILAHQRRVARQPLLGGTVI